MKRRSSALVMLPGLLVGSAAFASHAAANPYPDEHVQFFRSPSGNIHCEIDFQRGSGIADGAYCMSVIPMQHVLIRSDGSLADVCTNDPRCGSNGPLDEVVLPYGRTASLGPFTCLSQESGMTCTANGRGFTISSAGIAPV